MKDVGGGGKKRLIGEFVQSFILGPSHRLHLISHRHFVHRHRPAQILVAHYPIPFPIALLQKLNEFSKPIPINHIVFGQEKTERKTKN